MYISMGVSVLKIGYVFGNHLLALSTSTDTNKLIFGIQYSHQLKASLPLKKAY